MHLRATQCFVLLLAMVCLSFSTTAVAADVANIDFQKDVEYGTGGGEPLVLDLARPVGLDQPAPGLVLIHGGGWMAGNKQMYSGLLKQCAERGYVAVSVGYRFTPKHRFPSQIEDVKCATRWMRAHAEELGLDADHLGAMGHSAGAHLSMILGTMDSGDGLEGEGGWADQSSKVQAVVSYYGPANLAIPESEVNQLAGRDVFNVAAVRTILDAAVGKPSQEKMEQLKQCSPMTYVNEGDAPMLLFQGTRDVLVPYDQAFWMAGALTKAKVPGRVELIFGAGHGFSKAENERTMQMAFEFFDEKLKQAK